MNKEKHKESKKLSGFYIALCCCVIGIGIAGYFSEKASDSVSENSTVTGNAGMPQSAGIIQHPEEAVAANRLAENVTDENTSENADAKSAEENTENISVYNTSAADTAAAGEAEETAVIETEPVFIVPSSGAVLENYSDTPVYNSSLGDWRTHPGIDIAVESGGSVSAIADGSVCEISDDEKGMFVIIEHSGGFKSKYAALSSVENLALGDSVKAGDVIGIVTASKGESSSEPHIHFELFKDDETVNPADYIQY